MSTSFIRLVSRMLIVCLIGLPFQARAGMIGSGEAVSAVQAQAAHDKVSSFIDRAALAGQLQAFGLTPQSAKDRGNALSDAEIAGLAGRIENLPAGANGAGLGIILVLIFLFWRFFFSDTAKAEQKARDAPAAKPKPAADPKK